MNKKRFGVPCLKYLVSLPEYRSGSYTLPDLPRALVACAKRDNPSFYRDKLDTNIIYRWLNGFTVPAWAQLAALRLACDKGWQIIDDDDTWCAVWIVRRALVKPLNSDSVTNELKRYGLTIPVTQEKTLESVIQAINGNPDKENDLQKGGFSVD